MQLHHTSRLISGVARMQKVVVKDVQKYAVKSGGILPQKILEV